MAKNKSYFQIESGIIIQKESKFRIFIIIFDAYKFKENIYLKF